MNKIYKVIWSKAKHCYVVASEIAKSHSKSGSASGMKKLLLATLAAATLSCAGFVGADATAVVADTSSNHVTVYTVGEINDQNSANDTKYVSNSTYGEYKNTVTTLLAAKADAAGVTASLATKADKDLSNIKKSTLTTKLAGEYADASEFKDLKDAVNDTSTGLVKTNEIAKEAQTGVVQLNKDLYGNGTAAEPANDSLAKKWNDAATTATANDSAIKELKKQTTHFNTDGSELTNMTKVSATTVDATTVNATDVNTTNVKVTGNITDGTDANTVTVAEMKTAYDQSNTNKTGIAALNKMTTHFNTDGSKLTEMSEVGTEKLTVSGEITDGKGNNVTVGAITTAIDKIDKNDAAIQKLNQKTTEISYTAGTGTTVSGVTINSGAMTGVTSINGTGIGTAQTGTYIKQDYSIWGNLAEVDTAAKNNADAIKKETEDREAAIKDVKENDIGTVTEGTYVDTSNNVAQNLRALDTALKDTDDRTAGITRVDDSGTTTIEGSVIIDKEGNVTGVKKLSAESIEAETVDADTVNANKVNAGEVNANKVNAGTVNADTVNANKVKADTIEANTVTAGDVNATNVNADVVNAGKVNTNEINARIVNAGTANITDLNVSGTSNLHDTNIEGELHVVAKDGGKVTTQDVTADGTKTEVTDGAGNTSTSTQTATNNKSTIKDEAGNTTSTNQSAEAIKTYAKDEDGNKSYTTQEGDRIASSVIGEDGTQTKSEMTTTDITNTAKDGAITNTAKDLINKATEKILSQVEDGDGNVVAKTEMDKGGNITTTAKNSVTQFVGNGDNASVLQQTATDLAGQVTNGTTSGGLHLTAETVTVGVQDKDGKGATTSYTTEDIINEAAKDINNVAGGDINNTAKGDMKNSATNITNTAEEALTNEAKVINNKASEVINNEAININNTASGTITSTASEIKNKADKLIKNEVGENTTQEITDGKIREHIKDDKNEFISDKTAKGVDTSVTDGVNTSVQNQHAGEISSAVKDTQGNKNVTTSSSTQTLSSVKDASGNENATMTNAGLTANTITDGTHANTVASTASGTNFINSASTKGAESTLLGEKVTLNAENTTIKGNTITTGKATMDFAEVLQDLGVRGNATVQKNLTVEGESNLKGNTTIGTAEKNADLKVNGNTSITGTLDVAKKATFQDSVDIAKDLNVGGTATASAFKVSGTNISLDSNGLDMDNRKIYNVADGELASGSKEVVNGGQLYKVREDLNDRVDRVGANAAAMANLRPMEYDGDSKWSIAGAIGNYGSETAAAIGAFFRPNEDVSFNVSTTLGTGENMVGGGVSVRLGKGGAKRVTRAENEALKAQVDSLTARMDALLSVLNPNMSQDFPDVPENHWAYEAVSRLAGNGLVEGYPDGEFHGERTMSRYEMAEIIYHALSQGAQAEKELVEEFKPELQAMAASQKASASDAAPAAEAPAATEAE